MKVTVKMIAAVLLAGVMMNCVMVDQIQQRMALRNCQFDLVNVRPHSFSVMNMLLDLELQIINPNTIRVIMDRLDLLLYITGRRPLTAAFGGARIEPGDSRILTTTLRIPYLRVGMAVVDMMRSEEEVTYRLDGQVYLNSAWGTFRFPVTLYRSY